jgi:rubrerythrin
MASGMIKEAEKKTDPKRRQELEEQEKKEAAEKRASLNSQPWVCPKCGKELTRGGRYNHLKSKNCSVN